MAIWAEGGAARTALHALMGGAVSSITGGDFKSGAIAAGASQAMAGALNSTFNDQPNLRQAFSQIVGLTAAWDKWGQTTFRKHSEDVVCPLFMLAEHMKLILWIKPLVRILSFIMLILIV